MALDALARKKEEEEEARARRKRKPQETPTRKDFSISEMY